MSLVNEIVVSAVSGSLKVIQKFVSDTDFKEIADKVLNGVEGYFKEGSLLDDVTETITGKIREQLGVEDSNPDN